MKHTLRCLFTMIVFNDDETTHPKFHYTMNEQTMDHGPPKLTKMDDQNDFNVAKFMPRNRDYNTSLPENWEPTPDSVVIGRAKARATTIEGNQKLQRICQTYLEKYSTASSKLEKTTIVSRIVETVQDACPKGAFVKYVNGRYWEVDDHCAREKVGYVMRDLLHDKYKSSSKSKVARRRSQRSQKRRQSCCPSRSSSASSCEYSSALSVNFPKLTSFAASNILQGDVPSCISFQASSSSHQQRSSTNSFQMRNDDDRNVLAPANPGAGDNNFLMQHTLPSLMRISLSEGNVAGVEQKSPHVHASTPNPIVGSDPIQQQQQPSDSLTRNQLLILQGMRPQTDLNTMTSQLLNHGSSDQIYNIGQLGRIHPRFLSTVASEQQWNTVQNGGTIGNVVTQPNYALNVNHRSQLATTSQRNTHHHQWVPGVAATTVPSGQSIMGTTQQHSQVGGSENTNMAELVCTTSMGLQRLIIDNTTSIDNEAAAIAALQQIVMRNASSEDVVRNEDFSNIFDG